MPFLGNANDVRHERVTLGCPISTLRAYSVHRPIPEQPVKSFLLLTLFAGLVAAAPIPPGANKVNLIVNGGFEDCPESEANKPLEKVPPP